MATLSAIGGPGNGSAIAATQRREAASRALVDTATDGSSATPADTTSTPPASAPATSAFQGDTSGAGSNAPQADTAATQSTVAFAQARGEAPTPPSDAETTAQAAEAAEVAPAGGAGRAGGAAGAGGGAAVDNTVYDPLDTNQDGEVSELERLAGALKSTGSFSTDDGQQALDADSSTRGTVATEATSLYAALSTPPAATEAGSLLDATA